MALQVCVHVCVTLMYTALPSWSPTSTRIDTGRASLFVAFGHSVAFLLDNQALVQCMLSDSGQEYAGRSAIGPEQPTKKARNRTRKQAVFALGSKWCVH